MPSTSRRSGRRLFRAVLSDTYMEGWTPLAFPMIPPVLSCEMPCVGSQKSGIQGAPTTGHRVTAAGSAEYLVSGRLIGASMPLSQ